MGILLEEQVSKTKLAKKKKNLFSPPPSFFFSILYKKGPAIQVYVHLFTIQYASGDLWYRMHILLP